MFGHRYFGARYYGPRYFGDGAAAAGGGTDATFSGWQAIVLSSSFAWWLVMLALTERQ